VSAKVLAVEFEQVEGVEEGHPRAAAFGQDGAQALKIGQPTTPSPSIVVAATGSARTASTISGTRSVQSRALRLNTAPGPGRAGTRTGNRRV